MILNDQQTPHCKRCGRKLKSQKAKDIGYGETCYKKIKHTPTKKLFNLEKEKI